MAVQLIEGFEGGLSDPNSYWNVDGPSGGGQTQATTGGGGTAGPWSDYCYRTGSSGFVGKAMKSFVGEIYGMANYLNVAGVNHELIRFRDSSGTDVSSILIDATGHVKGTDLTTTVGTGSSVPFANNTWNTIEWHFRIGDATGVSGTWGLMEVKINGILEFSATNIDSKVSATTIGVVLFEDFGFGSLWDDIIIYDTTGGVNDSWVGVKGVQGLFPIGRGSQEQWNPPVASAQRFYFPDGAGDQTNYIGPLSSRGRGTPVQPAIDSSWEVAGYDNGVLYRGELSGYRQGTASVEKQSNGRIQATTGQDVCLAQFVSAPLAAQTISGTFHMQLQISWTSSQRSQIVIRVVSEDGSTVRGILYAGDGSGLTDGWPSGANQNVTFPQDAVSPATLSSLAINDGDRLVVEFGLRTTATLSNADLRFRLGDGGSNGDLPDSESDTTTGSGWNPWIEFSNAITFSDNGNWQMVDDAFSADGDGTYVETTTDNDLDLYALENVGAAYALSGPISIKTFARRADPGARTLTHAYKTSGAAQLGSAQGLGSSYTVQETLLDKDATTSTVWTDALVNSMEVGIKATT